VELVANEDDTCNISTVYLTVIIYSNRFCSTVPHDDLLPQSATVLENLANTPGESPIDLLVIVFHGGTVVDSSDQNELSKNADFTTFKYIHYSIPEKSVDLRSFV